MTSPFIIKPTWTLDLPRNAWRARGHVDVPAVFVDPTPDSRMQFADLSTLATGGVVTPPSDTFVLGTTKPDATNTGQAGYAAIVGNAAAARTVVNGDVTLSTPGQVYANKAVTGYIYVRAANVTVRNCSVTNRNLTGYVNSALIDVGSTNATIEFCDIRLQPDANSALFFLNGIKHTAGNSVTVRRCNIGHTPDGIYGDGTLRTQGNFIHHRAFFTNSTDHPEPPANWEHIDGIQCMGGTGHYFDGDYYQSSLSTEVGTLSTLSLGLTAKWGAGITFSPRTDANGNVTSPITGATITRCWFGGGGTAGFQMNSPAQANSTFKTVGTFSFCRFAKDQYDDNPDPAVTSQYQIRYQTGLVFNQELTNYWDPDDPSVPNNLKGVNFYVGFAGGIRRN